VRVDHLGQLKVHESDTTWVLSSRGRARSRPHRKASRYFEFELCSTRSVVARRRVDEADKYYLFLVFGSTRLR
jgi:hypothetical protein